jgi:hypothetical protein
MNSSKAFGAVFLSAAIGWCGFSIAQLIYPKLPVDAPSLQQTALVAAVSASGARDTNLASLAAPALELPHSAKRAMAEALPDPVAAGPASAGELPDPLPAATTPADAASVAVEATPAAVEFEETDILAAVQQGTIEATLRGNGRERVCVKLRNNSPAPMRVTIATGQVLEGGRNRVVVTRAAIAELMPARTVVLDLATAALNSSNIVGDASYKLSYRTADRVDGFLQWAGEHGVISAPAMQTAILAITENLPLKSLAKFAATGPAENNADAFRVETGDLLAALTALRDYGAKMETLALAADPQLRIEAMIEPLSREAAKRYYGITEGMEWEFWKRELLEGNPSTRHYALFGIARFYPDVALDMLPKWAREPQTHPVFRLAAVQALADTQRAEALPILRQIATEVGPTTDLGKAATQSANYLDKRLTELASRTQVVAFRDKGRVSGL